LDPASFERLFEAVRGPLSAYLRQVGGDAALAEDCLQEACIRLLNHPPRETDPDKLRSWLFTTATRVLRDHWRRERRFGWLPWTPDGGDAMEPPAAGDLQASTSAREEVAAGFRSLTPRQRSLLWLAHVEGLDHAAIARALALAPGSVKVLLHRARARMGATLHALGVQGGPR
jgi:RNA polymerase sigma-70 factor, ECF subfamily